MPEDIDTVSSLKELNDGDPIFHIEGKLTKLWPAKTVGRGTLQNGELEDSTGNIRIVFADNEQPQSARNSKITLESVPSEKHGWVGVKVKDEGEKYGYCIWVTNTAKITYAGGAPSGSSRRPQSEARSERGSRSERGGSSGSSRGGRGDAAPEKHAAPNQFEEVDRITSCYLYVHSLVNERLDFTLAEGETLLPYQRNDLVQRAAATIFVDVAKAGVLQYWNPKAKPRLYPPPPADPSEWATCYIDNEKSELHGKTLAEIPDNKLKALFDYYDSNESNTRLAECVYQAARDRGILKKREPERDPDLDLDAEDDIPF